MKCELSVSAKKNHVLVRLRAPMTTRLTRMLEKAYEKTGKDRLRGFLVDIRGVQRDMSPLDFYQFAHGCPRREGEKRRFRFAVLKDTDDRLHDFIHTVAQNAGYDCEKFTDENAAEKWLDTPESSPAKTRS